MNKNALIFMSYLISSIILILPWVWIPSMEVYDELRLPKAAVFDLGCFLIICYGLVTGFKFSYKNKYLALLSIWIFLTMFLNWYIPIFIGSQKMPVFNVWAIDSYIHYILALFASIVCLSTLENLDYIRISKAICFSAVAVTIFGFLQIAGFDPLKNIVKYKTEELNHFSALIDHPNMIGNYLTLSFPFFLAFKETKYKIGAFIVFIGIIVSKSTLSIFVLTIILCLYALLRFRTKRIFSMIVILLTLFFIWAFSTPSFNKIESGANGRLQAWRMGIDEIKENPLFGRGAGITKMLPISTGNEYQQMKWVFLHNDYLEVILQFGLWGLFLFSLIVLRAVRFFNYKKENILGFSYICSFFAFLGIMGGSFPMEVAPCALNGLVAWWGVEKIE